MSTVNLLELTPEALKARFKDMGLESYRAGQALGWVYQKSVYDFDAMSNLSQGLKARLKENFSIALPAVVQQETSHEDLSTKLLLKLADGRYVETVYIPVKGRETVCVSTQAGCKFHCAFCASGQNGFIRNLTSGEILSQVLRARDLSPQKRVSHIVFMGIGEPLDNYDPVLKAIRILNSKDTVNIGARRITVSTCGVIPKIEKLSQEGLQIELSVSLHGPSDKVRGSIMPVNKVYAVKSLVDACKNYVKKTKRAITFEYILIQGVNASPQQALELARLLKGILCKVNLIPYNPIEEFPHSAPSYPEIVRFQKILQEHGVKATVRFSKGQDIQAACGQLRSKMDSGKRKAESG